jgi:hypothetical protein
VKLTEVLYSRIGDRDVAYAAGGVLLVFMAPIGWIILRLVLFWEVDRSLFDQVFQEITGTEQNRFLYAYMCAGTMVVMGPFGFFIGRASQQSHDRAVKLDLLNREVDEQKTTFERRFTDLGHSIKNVHTIMRIFKEASAYRKFCV